MSMPHEVLPRSMGAMRTLQPRKRFGAMAVVAVVVLAAGYWLVTPSRPAPKPAAVATTHTPDEFRPTDSQWAGLNIQPVETLAFHAEQLTEGKIAINEDRSTPVFSPFTGRVSRLIANPGDRIEKGAPLFAIEATENVQALNDLIAAMGQVNKLRSQLTLAQTSEARAHELYDDKAGSLKDWQQAQADLVAARNDQNSAEIALAAIRNRLRILGKSDKDIAAAETARQISAETVVAAPIGGTVLQRKVGLGQYLNAGGSDPVYTIGDLSTVWLIANVKETDAPLVKVGANVAVHVLAYPGRTFRARVTYVASSIDPATRRVGVRAEVDNEDGALKPEMFARFAISTGNDMTALAVPQNAIIYEADTARVWVALADRNIVSRQIKTGIANDGQVQVVAGLQPGEKIVTKGSLFIDRAAKSDKD
jgi:cobalt-zinc-cadmium efflux system membrane fusion protein